MKSRDKKYILEHAGKKSSQQIARDLSLKERTVQKFIERKRSSGTLNLETDHSVSSLWRWILMILIPLAGLIAYHNSFSGAFVFDDVRGIVDNPRVHGLENFKTALFSTFIDRPVISFSLAVNYALGGLDVWGYHAINLGIHILAALMLFEIVQRTFLSERLKARYGHVALWLAFSIALIWTVHPLQTQSVTYIIQRGESLMGLFYLLTLYCVIRSVTGLHKVWWGAVAVVACALGMGCKAVIATAPLLILIYDRIFMAGSWREIFRNRLALYLGLFSTWVIIAKLTSFGISFTDANIQAGFSHKEITPLGYAMTQPGVVLHYLKLVFWPEPLVIDYYWPLAETTGAILAPLLVIALLLGATVFCLRFHPALGFLGVWFFLILAPSSSIMPINDFAMEHRMYLSLAAVIALVVVATYEILCLLMNRFKASLQIRFGTGFLLLLTVTCVFGALTIRRNLDYANEVTLWADTLAKRPDNPRAHNSLGKTLHDLGQNQDAMTHYREAIRKDPDYVDAHYNLGNALYRIGKNEEAVSHFREALRINPKYVTAHNNLGIALASLKKFDQAIEHYATALQLNPSHAKAHNNWGDALARQGKFDEAIEHFEAALRINPGYENARRNLVRAKKFKLNST